MKAKRIVLAVLLTAALSVSCAAPAVLAESPAVPEVTTITVFRPNLGEEDYMGLQSADGETLLPPAFASIEVVGKFAIVYSDETDSFYLYDWQKRAFVAEYPMMFSSGAYITIAESWGRRELRAVRPVWRGGDGNAVALDGRCGGRCRLGGGG